jgi:hypothetical protein
VLDFGLAKVKADKGESLELTASGQIIGTLAFMAPEQTRNAAKADIRADIYSLGCTLYQLISGNLPFPCKNAYEMIFAHQSVEAVPLNEVRPDVPIQVAEVVSKMMAKDPAQRYQTPVEVAQALTTIIKSEQKGAPRESADDSPERVVSPKPAKAEKPSTGTTDSKNRTASQEPSSSPAANATKQKWLIGTGVATGVLLLGLVGLWASGLVGSAPRKDKDEVSSNSSPTSTAQPVNGPLRVEKIDVRLFARQGDQAAIRGLIGRDAAAARLGDQVTVEAKLSRQAYAYLIAFRPDGETDLCYPAQEDRPPPLTDRPHYPDEGSNVRYGLSDGAGLMVFGVVASDQQLPSYRQWVKGRSLAWQKVADQPREEVLWSSGQAMDVLLPADKQSSQRGKGESALPLAPAFQKLAESLQVDSSKNAIGLLGFAVQKPDP